MVQRFDFNADKSYFLLMRWGGGGGGIEGNSYFHLLPKSLGCENFVLCAIFDYGGG